MPEDNGKEATILYVDDTDAQRYAMSRVLRGGGFRVIEASTGSQALEMASQSTDLIVLDVNLPDINGLEVCQRIKASPETANTPVLQVSASLISTQARVAGLQGGADAYLIQPVDPEELIATVRALLRVRRAEEQARKQAREIEAIYQSAPVGLAMLDTNLRFVRINHVLAKVNGLPVESHLGKTVPELFPEIYPLVAPLYKQVAETGEAILNFELTSPAPAQPWLVRHWLVSMYPLKDERGQLLGINIGVQEITDRKRAEEEIRRNKELLQAFMDNMPVSAYLKDQQGRYLLHNTTAKRLVPHLEDSTGKTDLELFPLEIAEGFRRSDKMVIESGKPLEFTETTSVHGETRQWLTIKFPFADSTGQTMLAGMSLDLTDRKRLEELTLKQEIQTLLLEREMLARESERERLARELHDQSGQMLTSLLAGLRIIEDSKSINQAKKRALDLRELTSRAISEVGRLSRNLHPIVLDDLGLAVALKNYVSEYSKLHAIKAKIRVVGLGSQRLPHPIERGLYRIAQEALTNIARHAHASSVTIVVLRKEDLLSMRIRDNGLGFITPPPQVGFRGHLGLQGMRERAAIISGDFRVDSRPGEGACITVTVPLKRASSELEDPQRLEQAC